MLRSMLVPLALLSSLSTVATIWAQSDRGAITGIVTDSTGGVLPKASVSATNVSTGIISKTVTNDEGNYTIPFLPAGIYQVRVELSGFRTYVREGITIQMAQTVRLDVTLEVVSDHPKASKSKQMPV